MNEKNPSTRVPEDLVDRFFDRELDEGSREKLFGMLRADLSQCAEVAKTQRMIGLLREPVEAPDLTDRIMARVARRRGFLPEGVRRLVTAGRLAAAACVLIGVLTVALVQRFAPEMLRFTPVAQPLSNVIESSKSDAAGVQQLAGAVVVVKVPAVEASRVRGARSLSPVLSMSPGKVSVWTLAGTGSEQGMALPSGTGGAGGRFIVLSDGLIDGEVTASLVPSAECPRDQAHAFEQFIQKMMESMKAGRGQAGGQGDGKAGAVGVWAPAGGSGR